MVPSFSRRNRWIAGSLLALAVLAVAVALFDWNWLRGPIASRVTSATGRSFAIRGDLQVHWSWPPRVVANDVVLGNAAGSAEPTMVAVQRIEARVKLLPLLAGRLDLPELTLSGPHAALEVGRDGVGNWVLAKHPGAEPARWPTIGQLAIDGGTATYRDAAQDTDLTFDLKTTVAAAAAADGVTLAGKGRFKGQSASVQAHGGALLGLRDAAQPYVLQASGNIGATRFGIDGQLLEPLQFRGERLAVRIAGPDLALLFPITGIPLPASPAYQIAGLLDHRGDIWTLRDFKGTLGHSDLAGEVSVDRGQQPQKVVATVVSKALVLADLAGFIGAGPPKPAGEPPRARALPADPFRLDKLLAADVDLHFKGDKIVTANLPLERVSAHMTVSGGVLKLAPLDFGVAGGNLVSTLEMDGRQAKPQTRLDITAKGLHLDRLVPSATRLGGVGTGTIGGRAALKGSGASIAQILASANGDAALIMEGGSVGELALRMSNLDVANSLLLVLGGDKQVPVRCMVGIFGAVDGVFTSKALVLDTPKASMTGHGTVDLRDESLHLQLVTESKGFSLASLRGPLDVSGTLKNPVLRPALQSAGIRGGLAVALGVATGGIGAALLPLLDFGTKKDSDCAGLLLQARQATGVRTSDTLPQAPATKP
jgi:uncharacterized protein involved in outer membrane biogenesis